MPTDRDDYESRCELWVQWQFDRWLDLYDALSARSGWYFDSGGDDPPSPTWCFGEFGACRLAVAVHGGGGVWLYDHAADREHAFIDIESLLWWLDRHEHEYAGLTPLQEELTGYLASPEILERQFGENDDDEEPGPA